MVGVPSTEAEKLNDLREADRPTSAFQTILSLVCGRGGRVGRVGLVSPALRDVEMLGC
jgi:hypothetical protein